MANAHHDWGADVAERFDSDESNAGMNHTMFGMSASLIGVDPEYGDAKVTKQIDHDQRMAAGPINIYPAAHDFRLLLASHSVTNDVARQ